MRAFATYQCRAIARMRQFRSHSRTFACSATPNVETLFSYYKLYSPFKRTSKKFAGTQVECRGDLLSLHAYPALDLIPLFMEEACWSSEPTGFFDECVDRRTLTNEIAACPPFLLGTKWISHIAADSYIHMEFFFYEVLPALEGIFNPHKTSIVRIDHTFIRACGWPVVSRCMGFSKGDCEIHCCEFKQFLSRFEPILRVINADQVLGHGNNSHTFAVQLILHPRYLTQKYRTFQRNLVLRSASPVPLRTTEYAVKYTGDVFLEEMGVETTEDCEDGDYQGTEGTLPSLQRRFDAHEAGHHGIESPSQRLAKLRPLLCKLTERHTMHPSTELENRIKTIESSIWRLVNDEMKDGQKFSTPSASSTSKLADTAESHVEKPSGIRPVYHMLGS